MASVLSLCSGCRGGGCEGCTAARAAPARMLLVPAGRERAGMKPLCQPILLHGAGPGEGAAGQQGRTHSPRPEPWGSSDQACSSKPPPKARSSCSLSESSEETLTTPAQMKAAFSSAPAERAAPSGASGLQDGNRPHPVSARPGAQPSSSAHPLPSHDRPCGLWGTSGLLSLLHPCGLGGDGRAPLRLAPVACGLWGSAPTPRRNVSGR